MRNGIEPLVRQLRAMLRPPDDVRETDAQLLGRFITMRDEAAFESLVRRHGRMVFSVCLRLLGNSHDAEDAFQATFLVLMRRASSIADREVVGNWLYGVAYRTAQMARLRDTRRTARERQVADMAQPLFEEREEWQKLVPMLDRELVRLPDKYRIPVVLCELEGRSRKDVARQLGVPEGTLSSRLATARKMLAKRLAKYGPSSGAVLATVLSQAAEASIPPALVSSTLKAALSGSSAPVIALAQGVLKAMFISKLKTVSLVTILAVSITVGAVGLTSAQQKTGTAPAPAVVETSRRTQTVKDELEVLRLEIEALRKDLKITKDRVQTLETEIHALKPKQAQGVLLMDRDGTLGYKLSKTPPLDLLVQVEPLATAEAALKRLREHPTDKKAVDAFVEAVKRLKESPAKKEPIRIMQSGELLYGVGVNSDAGLNGSILVEPVEGVEPFVAAEAALKHLRDHPNDKEWLKLLEQVVNELKRPKASTAPPESSPR